MIVDKLRMRDLIVLLPGISGSVLKKNGRVLWGPSLWAVIRTAVTLGECLQMLRLDWDDAAVDDLGDQIHATGLIQDAVLVPGLVKVDGYTKISEMIRECFEVSQGTLNSTLTPNPPSNYFEFAYDWRRDNRLAARLLKDLIDLRLPQWRAHVGSDAKVIILAHSMGGLVARHYLEVLGGWKICKALISFGTPYRGSLNALNYLVNGCRKYFVDMSQTMSTFTSVYQLLPTYRVVNANGESKKITDLDIKGINPKTAAEATKFHDTIMAHVNDRRNAGNQDAYAIFPVIGTHQPTFQSAELSGDNLIVSETLPLDVDPLLGHGDGTVPYLSAIPHELSKSYRNSFYAESHGTLQCNPEVLNLIYNQLQDLQIEGLENVRGPRFSQRARNRPAISLHVEDVYTTNEPVTIRANILEDGQHLVDMNKYREHMFALLADIQPVSKKSPSSILTFEQKDHEWLLLCEGLQPGLYRVEVRTAKAGPLAPPSVHELFEVTPPI